MSNAALKMEEPLFDSNEFRDLVVAHGFGAPTEAGYQMGLHLVEDGADITEAATEVVLKNLTTEP